MRTVLIIAALVLLASAGFAQKPRTGVELENEFLSLVCDRTHKSFTILEKQGIDWVPIIQNMSLVARMSSGDSTHKMDSILLRDTPENISVRHEQWRDPIGPGTRAVIVVTTPKAEWDIQWALYDRSRTFTLSAGIKNLSGAPWTLVDFRLMDPGANGRVLAATENVLVQVNGYQSWSTCSIAKLDPVKSATSYWSAVFNEPEATRTMLLGFVDNRHGINTIVAGPLAPGTYAYSLTVNSELRTLRLSPGEQFRSDKLMITLGPSPQEMLTDYGRLMQAFADSIVKPFTPDGRTTIQRKVGVPTGWCSWYYYYQNISEDSILANIETARGLRKSGIEYIQIDDGYQRAAGDWETNSKFPHGHKWLVDQIHKAGFKAGLWVAPFAVAESSFVFQQHPDWILKGPGDSTKQLASNSWWGGKIYSLDPTNPEVRRHLRAYFDVIVNRWGYDYVKIDFLYYAGEGASYHLPVSPMDAYRMGLEAIRKGVGTEKIILGCGAPIGPSVGYVDAMRIGQDVYAGWGGILPGVNAAAQRGFYHDQVWYNDPDCLLVRDPLTFNQARVWASAIALSGQMPISSDKLPALIAERTNLITRTMPSYGKSATQTDLFAPAVDKGLTIVGEGDRRIVLPGSWKFSPGDSIDWKEPGFDDSRWKAIAVPSQWENQGYTKLDGFAWYRVKFTVPAGWKSGPATFYFAKIDDCDQTYVNGNLVGKSGDMPPAYDTDWDDFRTYTIPAGILHEGENSIAVRVYDGDGPGGIWSTAQFSLPSVWNLPVATANENWNLAGIFNWTRGESSRLISMHDLGLSAKKQYYLYEMWSDSLVGLVTGNFRVNLPPTSCKVFAVHEKRAVPEVLATSRHITMGAIDIAEQKWDQKAGLLSVISKNLLAEPYKVTFTVPDGFKLRTIFSNDLHSEREVIPGVWQVTFDHQTGSRLNWSVQVDPQ